MNTGFILQQSIAYWYFVWFLKLYSLVFPDITWLMALCYLVSILCEACMKNTITLSITYLCRNNRWTKPISESEKFEETDIKNKKEKINKEKEREEQNRKYWLNRKEISSRWHNAFCSRSEFSFPTTHTFSQWSSLSI